MVRVFSAHRAHYAPHIHAKRSFTAPSRAATPDVTPTSCVVIKAYNSHARDMMLAWKCEEECHVILPPKERSKRSDKAN